MADNVAVGGVNYSTDDVTTVNGATVAAGTAQTQRIKVQYGDDGTARDVSSAFPLPVNIASSAGNGAQSSQALTAAGLSTLAGTTSTTGAWVIDVSSAGNVSFHLLATAFVGTVTFEQSFDPAGSAGTWAPVPLIPEDGLSAPATTLAINTAVAYVRQFTQGMFGPRLFRVRVSTFTSGTLTALGSAGPGWVEGQPALAPSSANIGRAGPQTSATAAITTATPAATSGTMLAANANRVGWKVTNDSNVDVLINEAGGTASATAYSLRLASGGYYESSGTNMVYTGAVTMLGVTAGTTTAAAAGSGACRVTEFV
jgi:hypothetical protein